MGLDESWSPISDTSDMFEMRVLSESLRWGMPGRSSAFVQSAMLRGLRV